MSSLTSTIDQPNQQIGRAVSLDTTIVLTKIESMIPMKSEFEEVDELSEEAKVKKKRKTANEIILSEYRNGLANAGFPNFELIPSHKRHDALDMHYFYDNGEDYIS